MSTARLLAKPSSMPAALGSHRDDAVQILLETPRGRTAAVSLSKKEVEDYDVLLCRLLYAARKRDIGDNHHHHRLEQQQQQLLSSISDILLVHQGKILERAKFAASDFLEQMKYQLEPRKNGCFEECFDNSFNNAIFIQLKCLGKGGMDRQNRVGSKFGGGGVSSTQHAERERKERLKRLALESIDLAKDPYLMRNHLGTYECKLCLTLHTNEANYLAHTQGKKHQQGLAKRAHMEKLREEKEQQQQQLKQGMPAYRQEQPKSKRIRIGRPAYQVFKSRDTETNQRCLSFELQYPEIEEDLQPRHRFMSSFEQRVESPPDRRFQYLLIAAEPYDTVAFKIPNEAIDKDAEKFVTHWDADDKKLTLTLHFLEPDQQEKEQKNGDGKSGSGIAAEGLAAAPAIKTEG